MPEFIIAYHGGAKPKTPEDGVAHRQKWQSWMMDLGDAMVNPGTPLGPSEFLGDLAAQEGANLTGFSVVKADDMEAALKIARACPFLDIGSLEVAEIFKM
ncbi:MAG: hypothetical protein GXP05_00735 [Alphaproteobacteria bacterium]|nr:hypothetical protein [Alphaproteobacteria bacterium]